MYGKFRRLLALCGGLLCAACQPTLNPVVPSGSAAYDAIAVSPDVIDPTSYALSPGDRVSITVFQEPDLSIEKAVIDRGGNLTLPLIGQVRAVGLSSAELASVIEQAYGRQYLRDPQVNIVLEETTGRFVSVEGEVEKPGVYELRDGYTLLSAIALAESPTETAKLDEVLVFRMIDGERAGARFDLTDIRSGAADDIAILPGDTVVVGFSRIRGIYRDILRAAPLFNTFVFLADGSN